MERSVMADLHVAKGTGWSLCGPSSAPFYANLSSAPLFDMWSDLEKVEPLPSLVWSSGRRLVEYEDKQPLTRFDSVRVFA